MKHVFTMRMPVRWGDMDAMAHVNNVTYFRYFEQARIEWFRAIGIGDKDELGHGPVVINASMTYLRQLRYPADIELRLHAGNIGRSSFETRVEIVRVEEPDAPYAEGTAKVVWCDHAKEKSVPAPDRIRALLAP